MKDACLNSPLRADQFRRRSDAGELGESGLQVFASPDIRHRTSDI